MSVPARKRGWARRLCSSAKPGNAAIFNQECQPGTHSRRSRPVIAKDAGDLRAYAGRFIRPDKDIERTRGPIASRTLLAADQNVEAIDLPAFELSKRRYKPDVLS